MKGANPLVWGTLSTQENVTRNACRSVSGTEDQSTESSSEEVRCQEGSGEDQVCRKAQDGTWQDHTEWHAVVAFGKTAEVMERWGKKGKMLYVEGRIQTREYTDKDGNKRWSTEIVANEIRMLGGKNDAEGQGQSSGADRSRSAPPTGQRQRQPEAPAPDGWDDDGGIPF